MKILLDTNILVAAFTTKGICDDLLEFCLKEHTIISSQALLDELQNVFYRKFKIPKDKVEAIIDFLEGQISVVEPVSVLMTIRDKDDLKVLAAAKAAKADVIITGDKDLLVLEEFEDIPILPPREFLKFINKRKR